MDKIQDIFDQANGRKIVIFGSNANSVRFDRALQFRLYQTPFFVNAKEEGQHLNNKKIQSYTVLNKKEYYVCFLQGVAKIAEPLLNSIGFKHETDYCNAGDAMNYDSVHKGVFIGKWSYGNAFITRGIDRFNCVSSIGRYVTVDGTAMVHTDHDTKKLTISSHFLDHIGVKLYDLQQGPITQNNPYSKHKLGTDYGEHNLIPPKKITVGNDVVVNAYAFINLSKCGSIGNGAYIGAGAVVNSDIPPYAIVVGAPARVAKYRFTEKQIEILERVNWWNWSDEEIEENKELFSNMDLFWEKFE
jgi:acetyltransferase-like isoleucine patch superfamily enzyme